MFKEYLKNLLKKKEKRSLIQYPYCICSKCQMLSYFTFFLVLIKQTYIINLNIIMPEQSHYCVIAQFVSFK